VSSIPARSVPNDHQAACEVSIADDASLTIVLARVLHFERDTVEYDCGILKGEAASRERPVAFDRIEGNAHKVIVTTETSAGKSRTEEGTEGT
jgi:hypothetical protein